MSEKIWRGKKKMLGEPCKAHLLGDIIFNLSSSDITILGNIHENPDLLKGTE